ncbi:MAG TPA: Ku protein [Bacillota bacterium]|nr:Ku protein [Bacillota bacterium]
MRSLWKGAVTFGLVHVPVRLYAATEDHDVHFRQLHAACHTPIQYRRYCPHCETEVGREDIARAVEVAPDEYIEVTSNDLEDLPLPTLHAIEILEFVPLQDVDPIYFERGYYVGPGEGGARAFALLRAVLADAGRAALTKVALRAKESLGLLRVAGPALALETMFYPDEVRPVDDVEGVMVTAAPVDQRELAIAQELVARLSGPFAPDLYHDNYRIAMRDLLDRKAAGRAVVRPAAAPESQGFEDLLAALQASVRAAEAREARAAGEQQPVGVGSAGPGGQPGNGHGHLRQDGGPARADGGNGAGLGRGNGADGPDGPAPGPTAPPAWDRRGRR